MRPTIVLATGNAHKIEEVRRLLDDLDAEIVAMTDLGIEGADETGDTFEANALIKARAVAAATGLAALADDSGLEVDALGGAPGVRSARYASVDPAAAPAAVDERNNRKLIAELAAIPEAQRSARFVCVAALVAPDGREWTARGTLLGRIVDRSRGANGFGYDPHFVADGQTRTTGELSPAEKDAMSHRGVAFRAIHPHVRALLTA